MNRIRGICIKSYQDEDDLIEFEDGERKESEIKTYQVGDEKDIMESCYDKKYWKPKTKQL